MNIYLFIFILLIFFIILTPNFLIQIPPEDLEWLNYKSYLVKNRIKLSNIIFHSLIYLIFIFLFVKLILTKVIKKDLKFKNLNSGDFVNNIHLL